MSASPALRPALVEPAGERPPEVSVEDRNHAPWKRMSTLAQPRVNPIVVPAICTGSDVTELRPHGLAVVQLRRPWCTSRFT